MIEYYRIIDLERLEMGIAIFENNIKICEIWYYE